MDLKAKKVLVVGAGVSGQWAARLLMDLGAETTINDARTADELLPIINNFKGEKIHWSLGGHYEKDFLNTDLIVLSPGLPWFIPALVAAVKKNIPITGELELAASFTKTPIAAITGSNGKTTTTELLGHILKKKHKIFVGGNIGDPLSMMLVKNIDAEIAVLELSSFQLETVSQFHAKAAAILNISPDHLDRYDGMEAYFQTKKNIFINQTKSDLAVLNLDDEYLKDIKTTAPVFGFSSSKLLNDGACVVDNHIQILNNSKVIASKNWDDFQLWGIHNQENVMAALGLAHAFDVNFQEALDEATSFKPAKHRIEFVGDFNGVKYFDDSKGTNVGAVIKALDNFNSKVILIAGGREKGLDFSALKDAVKAKVKLLVLLGEARFALKDALSNVAPCVLVDSMAEAVTVAKNSAVEGEVVLLSPACASFDMFKNYSERGEVFVKEVLNQNQ